MEMLMEIVLLQQYNDWRANQSNCISKYKQSYCNGAADGTITASGSDGSVITINGLAPQLPLTDGTYTVVATAANGNADGDCTATTTVTIGNQVTVSASATNVSCNGAADGTITASGSDGSVITINGLAPAATYGPGTYTVVTAANGNADGDRYLLQQQ
jgi:hypothetical protein